MFEVVAAVIVDSRGRAFVHRRGPDRALFPGYWDIPGGHLEPGESALMALGREVHEETGWRLKHVVAELGELTWTGDDGIERRELDYLVEVTGDLSAPRLERPKHVEFDWVGLDGLDRLMENRGPEQALVLDIVRRGIETAMRLRAAHSLAAIDAGDGTGTGGPPP
ncbi:MAG TPA: NUDIX domain-containing protein [Gaiellaceae bacterium]